MGVIWLTSIAIGAIVTVYVLSGAAGGSDSADNRSVFTTPTTSSTDPKALHELVEDTCATQFSRGTDDFKTCVGSY